METYSNLRLATLNMALTVQGTPVEDLLASGRLFESSESFITFTNDHIIY